MIEKRKGFIRFKGKNGFFEYITFDLKNLHQIITKDKVFWMKLAKKYKIYYNFDPNEKGIVGIYFNQLKRYPQKIKTDKGSQYEPFYRELYDKPVISWIDVDFKTNLQIIEFIKDIGNKNKFLDELKNDPYIWFVGLSVSGGIRIGCVMNYIGDEIIPHKIHTLNQTLFKEYLKVKYNFKTTSRYADECDYKITQCSYPLKEVFFKDNNITIDNDLSSELLPSDKPPLSLNDSLNRVEWNDRVFLEMVDKPTQEYIKFLEHRTTALEGIIQFSSHRELWREEMIKYYTGTSLNPFLSTIDRWENHLNNQKIKEPMILYYYVYKNK